MSKSTFELIEARQKRAARKRQSSQIEEKELTPSQTIEGIRDGVLQILNMPDDKNPISNNYIIHRGIHLLAQNTAQVPLRIFRGEDPMAPDFILPGGFDLQNPNSEMSLYELVYEGAIYYYYRGEQMFGINLIEGTNKVLSLQIVNPRFMKEKIDKSTGKIVAWQFGNNKVLVPVEQVIFTKFFDPDGLRGLGPVEVVRNELTTDTSATNFNINFFKNFGQIGGTLFDDQGQATQDEMRDLVNQFNNAHQGSANAYKTLGLPAGIKYQEMKQTMKEMQMLESRRDIRDRILVILGIHKALVGVTDQVDRAVADTAMRSLWQLTLKPSIMRMQNKLNQQLFKPYFPDFRCEFDFSGVEELKKDQSMQAEIAKTYRELGYTLNEINERFGLGMDEVTDEAGDLRLVPQNMIPFTDYTDPAEPVIPATDDEKGSPVVVEKRAQAPRGLSRRHHNLERKVESSIHKGLRSYFQVQLRKIKREINQTKAIDKVGVLVGVQTVLEEEKVVLQELMVPIYSEGSKEAVALAQEALNITPTARISETVVGNMTNKIRGINDHTYNLLRKEVVAATDAGETLQQLNKRIDRVYKFNTSRSRTIARTESSVLVNSSTNEEYANEGVKMKRWLANPGARESHAAADGQGAIPFNQTFNNGLMHPGDNRGPASELVNCRCSLSPVIETEGN